MDWPKKHTAWIDNRVLHISIPFTWNLPEVKREIRQLSFEWDSVIVGGPAVELIPGYFGDMDYVSIGKHWSGVLQMVNPLATRTTTGCIRNCGFCAVPKIEVRFKELSGWPNLPIICDNNLLAASMDHFDKVIDRLKRRWEWADFNQGVDSRLLNDHHAKRFKEIKKPTIRLALDSMKYVDQWEAALDRLFSAGIAKRNIKSYAIIAFDSDPEEAWTRCNYIESKGIKAFPMWYRPLNILRKNTVTHEQKKIGWNDFERRKIMQWFYQHKKAVRQIREGVFRWLNNNRSITEGR